VTNTFGQIAAAPWWAAVFVSGASAQDLSLAFPVACELGVSCHIQQYFDHDPGPGSRDFTCGALSYDGHSGTDIRVADLTILQTDIEVFAAAPGQIVSIRNTSTDSGRAGMTPDQECGNGVVLNHAGGWQTQYCHMRQGSVQVTAGQHVETGTPLGLMGLSGNTEFPHLHLTVRQNGENVDPFAPNLTGTCDPDRNADHATMWQNDLDVTFGGVLSAGFSAVIPEFDAIRAGHASVDTLPQNSAALVFWGYIFGGHQTDQVRIKITDPHGETVLAQNIDLTQTQAELFRAVGRRSPPNGWQAGQYIGMVSLIRNGETLGSRQQTVEIATP
jgi:murein DD-endopeptidase MepM/ murein hydrolase activator NlpD